MTALPGRNPFPGLRPFRAGEEHLFFGREDETDAMVDKLAARRFLAVLGTSGSGKSSLVNCGLRPALHGGLLARAGTAWRVATCRPGGDPFGALARSLAADGVLFDARAANDVSAGPAVLSVAHAVETTLRMSRRGLVDIVEQARLLAGANVLVVVDQFEELFRYRALAADGAGADDAAAFVNLLLQANEQAACPLYVVLTMRSDFLGDCTAWPGLAQAISDGQYLVPRMTRDERRAAIAGPVGVAGGAISPVLVTRLVNDVGDDPDQLSILQHALNRTWARWSDDDGANDGGDGAIELRHYEAIGTMAHALDRHAEDAWAELRSERERTVAEKLFKALTDQATDPRGVRRPARLATLAAITQASEDELRAVIEVFREPSRSFLMPPAPEPLTDATVIDISHESLMRVWERLKVWAAEEALAAQQLRRLGEATALHARGEGGLWRDPELQLALQWRARQRPNAAWAAQYRVDFDAGQRFLAASERRRGHRRIAAGALVALLAVLGALFFVLWQRSEVLLAEARDANLRKSVLSSRAMLDGQVPTTIDVALLLAAAAYRLGAGNEAYGGLQYALQQTAAVAKVIALPGPVLGFSADQRSAVTVHGNVLRLWDAASGAARGAPLVGHTATVNAVAFSADGALLVSASDDKTLRRWDAATGAPRGEALRGQTDRVWSVAVSPDGATIASGSEDGSVRLWDAASGAARGAPLLGHALRVWSLAFSPDGRSLASGSDDHSIRVWDVASGTARGAPLRGHGGAVSSVAFSADGTLLASGGGDNELRVWDTATLRPRGAPMRGHTNRIWSVAFSPDGRSLASGAEDQIVRLWDVASGQRRGAPFAGHKSRVWRVAFAADGASVLSASNDHTLIRWHARPPAGSRVLAGHAGPARSIAISADGRTLASGGDDGSVRLWDAASGTPRGAPLRGHGASVSAVALSPDSRTLASVGEDGTLRLWDAATGAPRGTPMNPQAGPLWDVAFSPDGRWLATGGADGSIRLWDALSGAPRGEPWRGHASRVWSVAFSPDGKTLASGSDDTTVRRWTVATGEPLGAPLRGHTERVWSVAFSPDGRAIASGSEDGSVRLWDAATGAPRGDALTGHLQAVTGVAFSPDGKTLASGSDDATVRLWDARSGAARGAPLRGHQAAVAGVAFSPDGKSLVSAAEDGNLRVWDAPDAWIDRVRAKLTRNLTRAQWRRHVGEIDYVTQYPELPVPAD